MISGAGRGFGKILLGAALIGAAFLAPGAGSLTFGKGFGLFAPGSFAKRIC